MRPAAPYIGGNAEPFVGVFLRRRYAPRSEVINDISGDVATFFRILQRHYVPFMEMLKFQLTSRRDFERLNDTDPATLTDLERAARFLYLQRISFGGKVAGKSFGVSPDHPGRFNITKLAEVLTALNERLAGVVIENLPYGEFIARYDTAETLFYLDPPYLGTEDFYVPGAFTRADFRRLAQQLAKVVGSFILTINDTPETRAIFADFQQERAEVTYTAAEGAPKQASELIISRVTERRQTALPFD
jgi:DNA adenine methylase